MTAEANPEELENQQVPHQEGEEEEEEESGVTPGAGESLESDMTCFPLSLWFLRADGAKKKKKKKKPKKKKVSQSQSDPPRVGLSKLFPSGVYPTGEICEYKDE